MKNHDGSTWRWRRRHTTTIGRRHDDDATTTRRPSQARAWHVIARVRRRTHAGLWLFKAGVGCRTRAYDGRRSVVAPWWPRRHVVVMPSSCRRSIVVVLSAHRRQVVVMLSSCCRSDSVVIGPEISSKASRRGTPASTRKLGLHVFGIF